MRKMKTVFITDNTTDRMATPIVRPENQWVLNGEGVASIKFDGTAATVIGNKLYKRWDRKLSKKGAKIARKLGSDFVVTEDMFKVTPAGAIPCDPTYDPVTYHHPHWVPVGDGNEDIWFREALLNVVELSDGATYELVGPKFNGNIYNLDRHELWRHGSKVILNLELTYDGIRKWLAENEDEGLVFKHPDGRSAKIRRGDMFDFKTLSGGNSTGGRKVDWRTANIIF
jgi:hypothetical protein